MWRLGDDRAILARWWPLVACLAGLHLAHVEGCCMGGQPNIVFVLADDQGYNDTGYHGSDIHTPNIDQISAEGVRLENYYVQPHSTPTRSQLMTGHYQIHTGLQHGNIRAEQPNGIPLACPTLGDKLREVGYATHYVGKWHLGFFKRAYLPIHRGFDTFYGIYTGSTDHYSYSRKFHFDKQGPSYLDLHDQDQPVPFEHTYSTHLYTAKAIERIKKHTPGKPFFLMLSYQAVHAPMEVPIRYTKPYKHIARGKRLLYDGMMAALDEGVGNVTKALKEADLWNNTVFIYSTDNGGQPSEGASNFPLRGGKGTLWEGGIRGVGFVRAPNMATAHTNSDALIHVSDWFPTLVRLAGGSLNGSLPLDGVDQWSAIYHGAPSARTQILHAINDHPRRHKGHRWGTDPDTFDSRIRAAIREGDWKLITGLPPLRDRKRYPPNPTIPAHPDSPPLEPDAYRTLWLYNVTGDPSETTDVAHAHPEVVKHLLQALKGHYATYVPVYYPPRDRNANPALRDQVWGPWME